jgi:hypothetical protein
VPVAFGVGRFRDLFGISSQAVEDERRWMSIDGALRAVMLPPVRLYKIGDVYFVKDGITVFSCNGAVSYLWMPL